MEGARVGVEGLPVRLHPVAHRLDAHGVGVRLQLRGVEDPAAHERGFLLAVVEVEHEGAEPLCRYPAVDDVEGRLLLGDEHDFPALGEQAHDEVRDGLRLARARRPLDDQGVAGESAGDDAHLGGVGGDGQSGEDLLGGRGRHVGPRVGEDRVGGVDEVVDQGVAGQQLPRLLQVLPQAEVPEVEDPQVRGGLHVEGESGLGQGGAHGVEQGGHVDARLVCGGLAQPRHRQPQVEAEPLDERVVRGGRPRRVDAQRVGAAGRPGRQLHRDEHQRGAHGGAARRPHQRAQRQVQVVRAGLLGQGARLGAQRPQRREVRVIGDVDLHAPVVGDPGGQQRRVELLVERPARAAARGRPLARALQGDGAPRGDEVLDRSHDGLGDRQLDQPVRGDGGVGAVDEAVARAQVQQRRLPPLDAGRGGGQGGPGAALFRQVLQGDRVRPLDDGRGDLDDGAVLADRADRLGARSLQARLADGHDEPGARAVRPQDPAGARRHFPQGRRGRLHQGTGVDEADQAPVDLVDQLPPRHRHVLRRVALRLPVPQDGGRPAHHDEGLDAQVLEGGRQDQGGVQARGEAPLEHVLRVAEAVAPLRPVALGRGVGDGARGEGVAQRVDRGVDPLGPALVAVEGRRARPLVQERGRLALEVGQAGVLRLDEGRQRHGRPRLVLPHDPLARSQDLRAAHALLAAPVARAHRHDEDGGALLGHPQQFGALQRDGRAQ